MKEKKTTIPPAGAVKPTTANKKPLLMMALRLSLPCCSLFVPVPEGLPPYAWHYFAIFVGVIVGLIFEPLPGAVIGITGVVVIALCSQWLLFSPDQMAAPGFKMAGASFKWAVSGFGNSTIAFLLVFFMLSTCCPGGPHPPAGHLVFYQQAGPAQPWMFVTMFLFGAMFMASFMSQTAALLVFLPIAEQVFKELKYEKGDRFPQMLVLGLGIAVGIAPPTPPGPRHHPDPHPAAGVPDRPVP